MGNVALMRLMRKAHKTLVRKPEEKRSLARTKRRCRDNIEMDLRTERLEGMKWSYLVQHR